MLTTADELNKLCEGTLISHLAIQFTEVTDNKIVATMPVDKRTMQPMGLLHGGAILALMETVGSAGSYLHIDEKNYMAVGIEVNANHVSNTKTKSVYAVGRLLHKGKRTHVWSVEVYDSDHKPLSFGRVTNMIIESNEWQNEA
ncbi:MAG TPA: PaaI family thioesterase [Bacteroidales bacterium]|nr:PaaI family thioesterase [Bacteroidales bacterium]HOK98609.1 PaaI family thioesterase [Bacteroidales bacterium]HPO65461.1 PaaI family thioesterase [Bacteroidales bacterium]